MLSCNPLLINILLLMVKAILNAEMFAILCTCSFKKDAYKLKYVVIFIVYKHDIAQFDLDDQYYRQQTHNTSTQFHV